MKHKKGFTLIEILITIAIIGILAGAILVSTTTARNKAQWTKYIMEVNSISKMVTSAAMSKGFGAVASGYGCLGSYAHTTSDGCWGGGTSSAERTNAQINAAVFPDGNIPKGSHPPNITNYGIMMYNSGGITGSVTIYAFVGGGNTVQCDKFGWEAVTKVVTNGYCQTTINKW